jgi:hypothetical protein
MQAFHPLTEASKQGSFALRQTVEAGGSAREQNQNGTRQGALRHFAETMGYQRGLVIYEFPIGIMTKDYSS